MPEVSLCLMEPVPASHRLDLPPAKSEPISYGCSSSGVTDLTRGKNCNSNDSWKKKTEYVRETTLQKPSKEKGVGATPGVGAEVPLQLVVKTMERQLCPCSPWRFTVEPVERVRAGGSPKEAVIPMGSL